MGQDHGDEYVAYYRKSVGRAGISRQRTSTAAMIEKRGGRIIAEYVDTDRTAYQKPGQAPPKREDFDALIAHLAAVPGLRLAAWHCDRILRNGPDTERIINACASGDHLVVTVRGGEYDLGTATGRKRIRNDAVDAQYEVDHAIERITAQKAEAVAEGRWLGGRRPFGWQPDPGAEGGLVLDPVESSALAAAAEGILIGRTTHAVAREWNASELLTSTRRRWTPAEVRRVLLRPSNVAAPPARWPRLLDPDVHRRVTAILTDPARRSSPGPEVAHLLSGIARCGMCWSPMISSSTKRGTSRLVYRCRNAATSKEGGDHVARSVPSLDAYIEMVVIERFSRPDARELLMVRSAADNRLEDERQALRDAMRASNDLRRRGLLTPEEFAEERAEHQARLTRLDARIEAARAADVLAPMVRNPAEAWKSRDLAQKRAIIRTLMEVVVIPQPRGRPKGWTPGAPYFDPDTVEIRWRT